MITVEIQLLNSAITKLSSIAIEKSNIDILRCIAIDVRDGQLNICANNLDIQADVNVKCDGECEAFAVNASRFFALVKTASKNGLMTISHTDGRVKISAGRSKWDLPSMPIADFPKINEGELSDGRNAESSKIRLALIQTKSSQSTQINQPNLCGTYIHNIDGKLTFASTNGGALHISRTEINSQIDGLIMPSELTSTLLGALPENGDVSIKYSDRMIKLAWDDCSIIGKLIDGTYPEYSKIIPVPSGVKITADVDLMISSINAVVPIADNKSKRTKFIVSEGKITIENIDQSSGIASSEIPAIVDGYTNDFCFAVNGLMMLSMLNSSSCETITIDNADKASSMGIIAFNPAVPNGFSACIAPMKL
jgi:DNA polymerase III subunit beta